MTRVSRIPLRGKTYSQITQIFWEVISELANEEAAEEFLNVFLSKAEKTMLAKRLAVAVMLLAGLGAVEISNSLKVSTGTIRDVNYKLADIRFKQIIEKFTEKFRSEKRGLSWLDAVLGSKSDMKARAKLLSGDFD